MPTLWKGTNSSEQQVEQVWFPGVHCNIGGGYIDHGLSDRAFLWMCLKAKYAGLGLKAEYMRYRVDPNYHGELRNSCVGFYRFLPTRTRKFGKSNKSDSSNSTRNSSLNNKEVLGEAIHYSAKERFLHATESNYREGYARKNLGEVLKRNHNITSSEPGEVDIVIRLSTAFWNDGGGSPESFPACKQCCTKV